MYVVKVPRSKYFQIVYFANGIRKTITTKKTTKEEADQILALFKLCPKDAINQIPLPANSRNQYLLSTFKNEYVEFVSTTKSKKYVISIISSFKQLIAIIGDIPLNEINIRLIDKFITTTFAKTQHGSHLYYRTLKAAFNKAVDWNYIPINTFTKIKFPKIPKSFPIFITEEDLLCILSNTKYEHQRDIITVAFYTGLRLGELSNMRWSWVDFVRNEIKVRCDEEFHTKNKTERIVPMCQKVSSILFKRFNQYTSNTECYVFYKIPNKQLYQEAISKQFKKIIRKAELNDKIHFHSLRHSFASLLIQKGVSLYVVKELLGHEDLSTTQIYSHLQKNNLKDAVNLL